MKKIIITMLSVTLVAGVSLWAFKAEREITNHPSQGKTVVAFGDSLVEGVGAMQGNEFPALLSKKLSEPIINMGVSGNTSADGLARVDFVKVEEPKVVIVLLGGNDFLQKIPAEETFGNIDSIVVKLQSFGAVVVLVGIRGGLLSDKYEKHFKEIAEKRGALYVPDVLDGLIGRTEFMFDAVHPNDAGYQKIADKIYPTLRRALE